MAGAIIVLAPLGCREDYRTGEKTKSTSAGAPTTGSWRFEMSEPWGPMYLPAWLPSLSTIKQEDWPFGLAGAYKLQQGRNKGTAGSPEDAFPGRIGFTWHSDPFGPRGVRARFANLAGRRFFLVSTPVQKARMTGAPPPAGVREGDLHTLVILDVDDGLQEQVLLPTVEAGGDDGPLAWDVLPFKDNLVIVYASGDAIYRMVGTFSHGDFTVTKPQVVYQATGENREIQSLRLRAVPDRLHILWCETMQLLHAWTPGPAGSWSTPVTIATTANCATCDDGADLVVEGEDVFVAWSDNRLRGPWDKNNGYDNDLKLFIAGSHDAGATFSQPVLFSDPQKKEEQVDRVYLTLADDKIVLCWTEDVKGRWQYGYLDRGMQRLEVGAASLENRKLLEAYTGRMKRLLGEVPYTPPRLPAARRPAMPGAGD